MNLEDALKSTFKSLDSSLSPHFKESEKIVEGCKLVCVEDPEVFASNLVLLGLNERIPEVLQALHLVSQIPSNCDADHVLTAFRDWIPQSQDMIDRGYPAMTWNLVKKSQVIARSLCIAAWSGCLDGIVPLEQRIVLYYELSSENEDSNIWKFCKAEETMQQAASWLANHTTPKIKLWHQELKQQFESQINQSIG